MNEAHHLNREYPQPETTSAVITTVAQLATPRDTWVGFWMIVSLLLVIVGLETGRGGYHGSPNTTMVGLGVIGFVLTLLGAFLWWPIAKVSLLLDGDTIIERNIRTDAVRKIPIADITSCAGFVNTSYGSRTGAYLRLKIRGNDDQVRYRALPRRASRDDFQNFSATVLRRVEEYNSHLGQLPLPIGLAQRRGQEATSPPLSEQFAQEATRTYAQGIVPEEPRTVAERFMPQAIDTSPMLLESAAIGYNTVLYFVLAMFSSLVVLGGLVYVDLRESKYVLGILIWSVAAAIFWYTYRNRRRRNRRSR